MLGSMDGSAGTLWVAAAGLALASAALMRFGLRQHSVRGWQCWVGALLLGVVALGSSAIVGTTSLAAPWIHLLVWPWPVLTLIGLRRFDARLELPAGERIDWAVAALGTTSAPIGIALGFSAAAEALVASALAGYAALLLWRAKSQEDAGLLKLLAAVMLLTALSSAVPALSGLSPPVPVVLSGAFGLAVMAFSVLMLMSERTERELRASRRRLRALANTDPLTGVPNRRRFNELVERSLRLADAGPALLLIFDIDHFKLINDRLGHAAGDRALRLVGRCMNEALRAQDVAGRLGGDEFVLLLRGTTVEQALAVASRIVERLQGQAGEHHLPCLGLSFGIAGMQEGESIEDTLRRADLALYEAKRQGRSRAVAAEGDEDEPVFSESRRLGLTA